MGRTSEKWDLYISCLQQRFCKNKWEGKHIDLEEIHGGSSMLLGSIHPVREIHSVTWDRVCRRTKVEHPMSRFQVKEIPRFHICQLYLHFTNLETCRKMSKPTCVLDPIRRAQPCTEALKHQVEDVAGYGMASTDPHDRQWLTQGLSPVRSSQYFSMFRRFPSEFGNQGTLQCLTARKHRSTNHRIIIIPGTLPRNAWPMINMWSMCPQRPTPCETATRQHNAYK